MPFFSSRRNTRSKIKIWVIFLALAIIVFGVIAYREFFKTYSHSVPAEGGIFTESTIGKIKNLSPLARENSLIDQDIKMLIFEGLLKYDPKSGKIQDGLAHLQVKNSSIYELTIKDNARFQDGKPVTVDDVIFTFESVIQNPHFTNSVLFEQFQYTTLEIVDKKTVEFRLIEPNFFFPSLLTVPILPKRYFKNAYIEQITDSMYSFNKNPIGAGPYQLKNIVPNTDGSFRVFLTKNKYYYGDEPKIDQIVLYIYPNREALEQSTTITHMYSRIPRDLIDDFKKQVNRKVPIEEEYNEYEYTLPRFAGVFFNLDRPVVSSISLRRALSFTFDRQRILESEREWISMHSFFFYQKKENQDSNLYPNDARKILEDGGFPYNSKLEKRTKGVDGDIINLKFITSTNPPVYSRFAQRAKQIWEKELNIKIDLQILEPEQFQESLSNRDYDMVLFGENYSQNIDSLSTWHSSQTGQYNLSNLTNNSIDFLINEIHKSGSQTDLVELNERLQSLAPALILGTPRYHILISSIVKNFDATFGDEIREHAQRLVGSENWYFLEKQDWNIPEGKNKFILFFQWLFGIDQNPINSLTNETPSKLNFTKPQATE